MKTSEYIKLYKELKGVKDINQFKKDYDENLLRVILSQRIVRTTKKDYYKIQSKAKRIATEWKNGKSFLKIAEEFEFPPVMIAWLVLEPLGVRRSDFRSWIKDLNSITDQRIKKELREAAENDLIYSQESITEQSERGKAGEKNIEDWLKKKQIEFLKEEDLRSKGGKTPDFLLKQPLDIKGHKVHWIESKASFGDDVQIKRDLTKQVDHYVKEHGPGMLVYWYGFCEDSSLAENKSIMFVDRRFFE